MHAEQRLGKHGFGRLDRIGRALEGGEFADEVQDRGHIVGCGGADRQRHGTIGSASAKARGLRRAAATQPAMISAAPAIVHSETISPKIEIGRATSELQSLMRISYAVFCLKKKNKTNNIHTDKRITIR